MGNVSGERVVVVVDASKPGIQGLLLAGIVNRTCHDGRSKHGGCGKAVNTACRAPLYLFNQRGKFRSVEIAGLMTKPCADYPCYRRVSAKI